MTISDHAELVMQKRQTRAMIDADPTLITVTRTNKVKKPTTGGVVTDPQELPPQRVRLIYGYVGRRARQNEPYDETLKSMPYSKDTLMGNPGLDLQRGDTFVVDGIKYRVGFVYNNSEYEVLANIENTQSKVD